MIKEETTNKQHPWVRLQAALKPYETHWYEWLQSDSCFLSDVEEKIIGYLFAFKGDIFSAASILGLAEKDYLYQLRKLIQKLQRSQAAYLHWVARGEFRQGK